MTAREASNILKNLRMVKADDPERAAEEIGGTDRLFSLLYLAELQLLIMPGRSSGRR